MSDEELAEALTAHKHEIGSLKHRMDALEKIVDSVHQLAQEIVGLTAEMKNMNQSMERLNKDVAGIKNKPAQRWELVVTSIIAALAGGFISTLF